MAFVGRSVCRCSGAAFHLLPHIHLQQSTVPRMQPEVVPFALQEVSNPIPQRTAAFPSNHLQLPVGSCLEPIQEVGEVVNGFTDVEVVEIYLLLSPAGVHLRKNPCACPEVFLLGPVKEELGIPYVISAE
jgi:hypothetical protein